MNTQFVLDEPAVLRRCGLLNACTAPLANIGEYVKTDDARFDKLTVLIHRQRYSPRRHLEFGIPAKIVSRLYIQNEIRAQMISFLYIKSTAAMGFMNKRVDHCGTPDEVVEWLAREIMNELIGDRAMTT